MVGKKKWKADKDIDGLIKSVSNSEVENFRYEVPTDEELDSLGFPNIVVNPPTLKYLNRLSQNATVTGEWAAEWLRLLICKEDELGVGFLTLSEEEQKMQRHQMAEEFRKSTRSLNWKKYKYALEKVAASSWDEKWDDEWSEEDASDGSEEDSGGEEGESEGVEASGCVVGSKEEAISVGEEIASASVTVNELEEMREEGTEKLSKYLVGGDIIEKMNMNVEEIGGMPDRPAVSHNMFSFHCYEDNDNVKEYTQPFSLEDWLVSHGIPALRYLPYQSNKEDWSIENWSGDRLKRESLGIIHSVLSSVMDYHENNGSNGNIQDHKNILLHQHVVDFGGSKRILYKVKLPEPIIESGKSSDLLGLAEDMRQVKLIFEKVLEGRKISEEMEILFTELMDNYPFGSNHLWKNNLLRNWPGMWDGKSRANFVVDFYYNWTCDSQKYIKLGRALQSINYLIRLPGFQDIQWIEKIPNPSRFYQLLTFSRKSSETPDDPANPLVPQYEENNIEEILRYSRDVLHHHRQTKGKGVMEINYIEICLSNLFKSFIVGLYMGMCRFNIFFN